MSVSLLFLCVAMSCGLVGRYQRSRGTYRLFVQSVKLSFLRFYVPESAETCSELCTHPAAGFPAGLPGGPVPLAGGRPQGRVRRHPRGELTASSAVGTSSPYGEIGILLLPCLQQI